jgi:hypothetical protein
MDERPERPFGTLADAEAGAVPHLSGVRFVHKLAMLV